MSDSQLVEFLNMQDNDVYIVMHHEADGEETDILVITVGRIGSSVDDGLTMKWTAGDIDVFGFDIILRNMLHDLDERIMNVDK